MIDAAVIRIIDQPIKVSVVGQDVTFTVSSADWSGTYTAKLRQNGPEGTDSGLSVTVADSYAGGDTTITATLPSMATLITSGERANSEFWLCLSRSESPKYGVQVPLVIEQTGNR